MLGMKTTYEEVMRWAGNNSMDDMGLRNNENHPVLKQVCWKDRDSVIAMYGERGWDNMCDTNIVRQHDSPVCPGGAYPAIL